MNDQPHTPSNPEFSEILLHDWRYNGNGFPGLFGISSLNPDGTIEGGLTDQSVHKYYVISGTWGEDSRQLMFSRTLENGEVQNFTGYLFDSSVEIAGSDPIPALAGTFTAEPYEDPRRPAFGWFAVDQAVNFTKPQPITLPGWAILTQKASWTFNGNGFPGLLTIDTIDENGHTTLYLFDQNSGTNYQMTGTWGEDSRQLTFSRTLENGEVQNFTGYLFDFSCQINQLKLNQVNNETQYYCLAGTFTAEPYEDPRRPAFGWFALRSVNW